MNRLTAKQLVKINGTVTSRKKVPITDEKMKLLEEVVQSPYIQDEKFFYVYKTTIEKAAKLGCELYRNRPFDKGNGNTALIAILTLLDVNGFKLVGYENDLKSLANGIQNNDFDAVTTWIRKYLADNIYIMPSGNG